MMASTQQFIRPREISAALVGFGRQGLKMALAARSIRLLRIAGVTDLYSGRLERAREVVGEDLPTFGDYRDLIERSEIQAVLIAVPEHWQGRICRESLEAGKHVYCETPMARLPAEIQRILNAQREGNLIFETAVTQLSSPLHQRAREIMATGKLGRITVVRGVWDTGSSLDAWQVPPPPDASPKTVDYAKFLGDAPAAEFDLKRFFSWPCYWDYGSGMAGLRFGPMLTSIHSMLGLGPPIRATASGGVFCWKDGREAPDALSADIEYSPGLSVQMTATQNGSGGEKAIVFVGTEGTLSVTDARLDFQPRSHSEPYSDLAETWPRHYREWYYMMHGLASDGRLRRPQAPEEGASEERRAYGRSDLEAVHLNRFVERIQAGDASPESLEAAAGSALAVYLINESYRRKVTLAWNPESGRAVASN